MLNEWEDNLPEDMHLAYLPAPLTGVRLRLSIYGTDMDEAARRVDERLTELRKILGNSIYEGESLQECIAGILKGHKLSLSVAESCTGGLISSLFTSMAGSSEFYLGSVTSYANSVKNQVLKVPMEIIENHGAVSSECVAAMADGVRKLTGSDYAVATSGIAGPGGGSIDKPVGLVWIGLSSKYGTETVSMTFKGNRKRNIDRFAANAMNLLRLKLVNELNN